PRKQLQVRNCFDQAASAGVRPDVDTLHVVAFVRSDGHVSSTTVEPKRFDNTPLGSCLEHLVLGSDVGEFTGAESVRVDIPILVAAPARESLQGCPKRTRSTCRSGGPWFVVTVEAEMHGRP